MAGRKTCYHGDAYKTTVDVRELVDYVAMMWIHNIRVQKLTKSHLHYGFYDHQYLFRDHALLHVIWE